MVKNFKKPVMVMMACLMLFPITLINGPEVEAAVDPITVGGILAHDSIKDGDDSKEPKSYAEVKNLITSEPRPV